MQDECVPAEKALHDGRAFQELLAELRAKARAQGLWLPFIPKEYGGMGLGPLANALVQMELGVSHLGALSMNSQRRLVDGPDEVHRWTVGRNVSKAFQEHGTIASAAGGDLI